MATKFFTNARQNTLLEKFKGIFEHNPHIAHFDALVGYFRSSGYFRIRPSLENVPQIRVLVGIDVDTIVEKYHGQGLLLQTIGDREATKEDYCGQLKHEVERVDYSAELEKSILQFVADIACGKIKIKAHPTRKLHAKLYIFRPRDFNPHSACEVISGSSNLTEAGLGVDDDSGEHAANYEFNVSLRDYDDVEFATGEFEKLWEEAVEILPAEMEAVIKKSYLQDDFTPFELYVKLLIEYFGKEIEFDPNDIKDLPQGFKRLTYQLDAVNQGYEILKKHNGFFLADVVGLGKTVVATLIARQYFHHNGFPDYLSRTLIVMPPALKSNWQETTGKFQLDNVSFFTNGSLHKIENPVDFDLVIVDEAHQFRNDSSEAYVNLQRICKTPCRNGKEKKVILVSATPLNNRPDDIKNQLLLFQDANDSTLEVNVGRFFARINKEYEKLIRKDKKTTAMVRRRPNVSKENEKPIREELDESKDDIARLYAEVRDKIIEPLTVRRTRSDLLEHPMYAGDLGKQGIVFPEVSKPEILLYPLQAKINQLYDETVSLLANTGKRGLSYARYRAIEYLKPEHKRDYMRPEFFTQQLAAIMKTLLIKRLDSSFHAFHRSLTRFTAAAGAMLKMIADDRIIIAPERQVSEYVLEDREDELLEMLQYEQSTDPGIKIVSRNDFEAGFVADLEKDHALLTDMQEKWQRVIENGQDPKWDKLLSVLESDLFDKRRNPERKLVVFSESLETTDYLTARFHNSGYDKTLAVNAHNRKRLQDAIRDNFDASVALDRQRSDYDVLVTTEVLSEGVNLHRANTILNYDTPWNATRLMQRIGRLNRIGATAKKIHVYNFFPSEQVEDDIGLRQRASTKLHAFHTALGEDSQIYSPDEEVGTFGLFDGRVREESEANERLQYLMEIRRFREESPEEFRRIANMPLKMRNAVANATLRNGTLTFLRNDSHNAFYYVGADDTPREYAFLEAAPIFKCDRHLAARPLPGTHHEQVRRALRHFRTQVQQEIIREQQSPQLNPQQTRAIAYLKAFRNTGMTLAAERDAFDQAIELVRRGRFQSLPKDINKLHRKIRKTPVVPAQQLDALLQIINKYLSPENTQLTHETHSPLATSNSDFSRGKSTSQQYDVNNSPLEGEMASQTQSPQHTSAHHSPLEGESVRQERSSQHYRWGGTTDSDYSQATQKNHPPLEGESVRRERSSQHTSANHSPLEGESVRQERSSQHTSANHSPLEGESASQERSSQHTSANHSPLEGESVRQERSSQHSTRSLPPRGGVGKAERSSQHYRWGGNTGSDDPQRPNETTRNHTTPKIIISQSYV